MMHAPQPQKLPPIGKGNKPKINTLVFIFIFKKDVKKRSEARETGREKKIREENFIIIIINYYYARWCATK